MVESGCFSTAMALCSGFQVVVTAVICAAANSKNDVVTELISLGAYIDNLTNVRHFVCLIMTLAKWFRTTNA